MGSLWPGGHFCELGSASIGRHLASYQLLAHSGQRYHLRKSELILLDRWAVFCRFLDPWPVSCRSLHRWRVSCRFLVRSGQQVHLVGFWSVFSGLTTYSSSSSDTGWPAGADLWVFGFDLSRSFWVGFTLAPFLCHPLLGDGLFSLSRLLVAHLWNNLGRFSPSICHHSVSGVGGRNW